VLVREAGGVITDLRGGAEMLTQGTVLTANENLHPQLLKLLKGVKAA
jgi:myo-inositol-1(or 4)-monophosphatase